MTDKPDTKKTGKRYKHQLVEADMIARIQSREWEKGSKIPPIDDLEHVYPYSRMTIFKAVHGLAAKGYLEMRKGVGTFVRQRYVSGIVGLVFGDEILHPENAPMAYLVNRSLHEFFEKIGCRIKMYIERRTDDRHYLPEELKEDIRTNRIDGLISASSDAAVLLQEWDDWSRLRIPYVDISNHDVAPHAVAFDGDALIILGIRYARMAGRKNIAVVVVDSDERRAEIRRSIEKAELHTTDAWLPELADAQSSLVERAFNVMCRLWQEPKKPDVLIVTDDIMAKGVASAALKLGVAVPEQLAIVTLANKNSQIFYPVPMPRIEYDIGECGRLAGQLLVDVIGDPSLAPRVEILRPVLRLEDDVIVSLADGGAGKDRAVSR